MFKFHIPRVPLNAQLAIATAIHGLTIPLTVVWWVWWAYQIVLSQQDNSMSWIIAISVVASSIVVAEDDAYNQFRREVKYKLGGRENVPQNAEPGDE